MPFTEVPLDIWTAAKRGLLKEVQEFVNQGLDINACQRGKVTALHEAAEAGQLDVAFWLLDYGANPNARTIPNPGEGGAYTALHLAVQNGHTEVVGLLLQKGAKIDAKTSDGSTPLIIAAESGRLDLVTILRRHGGSISLCDHMKHIPFSAAVVAGHLDIAKYLLEQGSDINHRSEPYSMTPLMFAALEKKLDQVDSLLNWGADIKVQDDRGLAALHHAVIGGAARVKKTEWIGKKPKVTEEKHENAIEIIKRLLAAGADRTAKDQEGMTSLDWAKKARAQDLIELLGKTD